MIAVMALTANDWRQWRELRFAALAEVSVTPPFAPSFDWADVDYPHRAVVLSGQSPTGADELLIWRGRIADVSRGWGLTNAARRHPNQQGGGALVDIPPLAAARRTSGWAA